MTNEEREIIDDRICEIMIEHGPDGHIDGHDLLTDYAVELIADERERCAKILSGYADVAAYDPEEHDDLMSAVARIRSGE